MTGRRSPVTDRRTVLTGLGSIGLAGCLDASGDEETDTGDDATDGTNADNNSELHPEYESTMVRVTTADGSDLGSVTAAIAETPAQRQLGLSDTEQLPADRGMVFVYDTVDDRTFIMPDMSFGIDIIFADDEGVITEIHHAPEPGPDEDGSQHRYPGRGQYVLEVGYEWTTDRGVSAGDVLQFEGS